MAESHRVRVIGTTNEFSISDEEPIASAVAFKDLSDYIWDQRPVPPSLSTSFHIDSRINPVEARDAINEVVADIDESFVISGIGKALDLGTMGKGNPVIVSAKELASPIAASVKTFNWDDQNTYCSVQIDGEQKMAEFVDGHTDYFRQLGVDIRVSTDVTVSYAMQRTQAGQDGTTSLAYNVWHRLFSDQGYEGHQLGYAPITEAQELGLLAVMQKMAGVER